MYSIVARNPGGIADIISSCHFLIRAHSAGPISLPDIEHVLRVLDHRDTPPHARRLRLLHLRSERPVNLVDQGDPEANRASFGIASRPEPHGHSIDRGVKRRFIYCADHSQSLLSRRPTTWARYSSQPRYVSVGWACPALALKRFTNARNIAGSRPESTHLMIDRFSGLGRQSAVTWLIACSRGEGRSVLLHTIITSGVGTATGVVPAVRMVVILAWGGG